VFVDLAVFLWVIHPWHKAAVRSAISLLILALVEWWYVRIAKRRMAKEVAATLTPAPPKMFPPRRERLVIRGEVTAALRRGDELCEAGGIGVFDLAEFKSDAPDPFDSFLLVDDQLAGDPLRGRAIDDYQRLAVAFGDE
jgi:hypothetical protein